MIYPDKGNLNFTKRKDICSEGYFNQILHFLLITLPCYHYLVTGVVILVILKIAIIAYTLLNTNDLGLSLFGARSLNTLTTAPGYSASDLTGAMCFLLYTNGDQNKMECLAR